MAKYPAKIYVKREYDINDENGSWLNADEKKTGHAVVGEDVEVAEYHLAAVRTVKTKVRVK